MTTTTTTRTKAEWRVEGSQVFEGDKLIGNYGAPGIAHYKVRLHNNFESTHPVLSQIDAMYQSEIDFVIQGQWDGGISWSLHNDLHGTEQTIEETLIALRNAACKAYPESPIARGHSYDMELQTDQRSVETLAYELSKFGEFDLNFDPADTVSPDAAPWTCTINGKSYGGYTADETIKFALSVISDGPPQ